MKTQPKPEAEPTINGRPLKSGSPTAFVYNGLWHDIRSVKGRENSHTCSRNRQASAKPISEIPGDPEKGVYSPRVFVRKWLCAVCGQQLLYDSKAEVKQCGCGRVYGKIPDSVLQESFEEAK